MTDAIALAAVVELLPVAVRRAAVAAAGINPGTRIFKRLCTAFKADQDAVALLLGWSRSEFNPKKWVPLENAAATYEGYTLQDPLFAALGIRHLVRKIVSENRQFARPGLSDAQLVEWFEELLKEGV